MAEALNLSEPNAANVLTRFKFNSVLSNDPTSHRVVLLGRLSGSQALLLVERTPFTNSQFPLDGNFTHLATIGTNDIYHWFLASLDNPDINQLKFTLIHPCTPKHIAKYTPQVYRCVDETAAVYEQHVRPYMQAQRDAGRLNWVWNILDGNAEQESILYQSKGESGFLVSPDPNWDGKTVEALHVLALVDRRDIWSLRDLTKLHVPWLREMRHKTIEVVSEKYGVDHNRLKLYVHYQPTYYHFHIHVVHCALDAGITQAVGKAFGLENLISILDNLAEGKSMANLDITYTVGENHDIWKTVFAQLQQGKITP